MHQGDKPTPEDLRRGPLLRPLTDAQLARVAARAVTLRLAEREPLFEQGDPADRFYLVLKGQIKLARISPDGNEKVIEIVTPGSTFAEALMFLNRPRYPVGASAIGPVEVISIDAKDFVAMLRESVETCFLLLGDMSRRLRGLIVEIDEITLHSATCRVAGYLLRRCEEEGPHLVLDVPKLVLASRLTVQPETFSRILRVLSDRGVVRIDGREVHVLDSAALRITAEGDSG
ncbi:MAG: Crp/Fnr family transcriptional regulator [Chromatiaceae bacterium]|jgi:CRP-like cAMP-binding protein|nr:Crp/Fnr family transcriptional regulator [Chromatiaceae bacterium]